MGGDSVGMALMSDYGTSRPRGSVVCDGPSKGNDRTTAQSQKRAAHVRFRQLR